MNPRILLPLLLAITTPAWSTPRELKLEELQLGASAAHALQEGKLTLKIDHTQAANQSSELLFTLPKPSIRNQSYALVGEVRYHAMPAGSFLELWNHFAAKRGGNEVDASFFSRTMGDSGPMAKLSGDSDWRPFQLPFFMDDGSKRAPLKLTFNVQFQGAGGSVEIRNLRLVDGLGKGASIQQTTHPAGLLAIGFTAGAAAATTVAVICWRVSSARTQRELRRIQSVDV